MQIAILRQIAESLMKQHGLLPHWRFVIDTRPHSCRLGCCDSRQKLIVISAHHVINSPDASVMDTLLHEIAHAIVGCLHGHDSKWRDCAQSIGAVPRICMDTLIHAPIPKRYIASCCGLQFTFGKLARRNRKWYCCKCKNQLILKFNPAHAIAKIKTEFALLESEVGRQAFIQELRKCPPKH